jgi:hypothetical protein
MINYDEIKNSKLILKLLRKNLIYNTNIINLLDLENLLILYNPQA